MPIPLMSSPSTPSTLIQCVIRTSVTCRGASLVPTAASTLASLIMTLSTKRFCHRLSKKEPQQYKFERAKFADDRKDEGPFTHASPRYGTFSYATACGSRKLNPAVHGELRVNRFRSRATITAHSATYELGDGHRSCARFLMRCSNDREGRAIAHDQSQRRAATEAPHASPEEEISASLGCSALVSKSRPKTESRSAVRRDDGCPDARHDCGV